MAEMAASATGSARWTRERLVLLVSLCTGHALMHCFQQGWYILLPSVKLTFGITDVQYGGIESIRSLTSTLTNLPAGAMADMLRKQWVSILTAGLIGVGLAFFLLGTFPGYIMTMVAAAVIGIAISLWHPPALSTLSARLHDRMGLALSLHGMGGEVGNTVGPLLLGFMVGAMAWQLSAQLLALPMFVLAIVLWLVLRNVPGREAKRMQGSQYATALRGLARNKLMMGILLSRGMQAMGTGSIFAFFSLYLQKDLGFDPTKTGIYYAVVMGAGILSQPFMGYLSDRMSRKVVIVPSLLLLGLFTVALFWARDELSLLLVAVGIGLFIYSVGAIVQAAAMDATDESTGAMTISLLFAAGSLFTIPSPVIAGALSTEYGTVSVFLYSGTMILIAGAIMLFLPLRRARGRVSRH